MILTNCAACAAPLAHNAPRCVRCKLRYCNKTCQHDHWRRGQEQFDMVSRPNYAVTLIALRRFEDVKSLLRKMIPVARRVAGDNDEVTFKMRCIYAQALYKDSGSTLDDLRESVATLEDVVPRAQRVQGGAHPQVVIIEEALRNSRTALDARRAQSPEIVAGEFLVRLKLG